MSDSDSDEPLLINMGSDNSDNEDEQVRIKIVNSDDSDDESSESGDDSSQPITIVTTDASDTQPNETTPDSASTPIASNNSDDEPEPWDDAMLQQIQSRDRINVDVGDQKLLQLRLQHEQKAATNPAPQVHASKPDRRLNPSKREEKREQALHETPLVAPSSSPAPSSSESPTPPVSGPRRKFITQTLVHIDLSSIKTLEDIEEAVSRLTPDPSPYVGIVVLTPAKPVDEVILEKDESKSTKDEDSSKSDEHSTSTTGIAAAAVVIPAVVAVAATPDPAQPPQKTAKELAAERKKQEEEAKKQAEADKKAKKEEEEKRKEDEKRKKEDEKKAKKEEEERRKEEEKRKKEDEKRRKEEEKLAKKNKGKTPPVAPAVVAPTATPENSTSEQPVAVVPVAVLNDDAQPEVSISRSSFSENSTSRDPNSLGGPTAPCLLNYHDPAFPQPITFEQATIILKSQRPYKIASKYQKANVFGTSGFRKPDHSTCYFYQHLWDTDYDPTNRAHVLLLNAFYMYMNDLVTTPVFNNDPANKGSERLLKCEVPNPTGPHWVDTLRAPSAEQPQSDLLGVANRYSILRPIECELRPSILTLYLAIYLLEGVPDVAYKKLIVALLRQFFFRDNSPSNMSYLELFTPFSYVINTLILSNTTVHAEPFYRTYYRYNLKKDLGPWINDDATLNGFLLAITQYMALLAFTFWFRHLIQQYDYPTLVCAIRQRFLTNVKGEFERIDSEYCRGGYATYINEVNNDNYLAQDLKVVFAEQKKQKHILTPLESQMHMNQQQRGGPGRNSISYAAPVPTPANGEETKQNKIGPNIVVGKTQAQINVDAPASPTNKSSNDPEATAEPAQDPPASPKPASGPPALPSTSATPSSPTPASDSTPQQTGPPPLNSAPAAVVTTSPGTTPTRLPPPPRKQTPAASPQPAAEEEKPPTEDKSTSEKKDE